MTDRTRVESLRRWAFLDGDRLVVAGLLTAPVFAGCLALGYAGVVRVRGPGVTTLLGSLIGGMLPFITVVLAINQLILAEEFGTTGTFRERLDETEEYRSTVESDTGADVSPAAPAAFLSLLIQTTRERAVALREACDESRSDEFREAVESYVAPIVADAEEASDRLSDAEFGTFEVVSVILWYDDERHLQAGRRIRAAFGDAVTDPVEEAFEDLRAVFEDIHVARQYFKTVYLQQELATLSKILLYVGFVALLGDGFVILTYESLAAGLGPIALLVVASSAVALVVAPFAVLLAYVLRIATVARRTAADFGPFLLQQTVPGEDGEDGFDGGSD